MSLKALRGSVRLAEWCWHKKRLDSRGPFLAAMFLLVFWILFWEPWWSRFVGIRGAPRLTEACPRHAWQELLWKKPPLRTSTCGRHRRQARMCIFPQRGAYSWWTWTTIPWKPWKFAEKHGQRIAYSWFNSIKRPYLKKSFLECKPTGQNGSHATARSV